MKAILIKKAEGWYNLYQDKIGIGSTYPELQGYKLSKQNCDEIFGVTDVDKLADERFLGSDDITNYNLRFGFKEGFNKAMELNKDKRFTEDDVITAIVHYTYLLHNDGKGYEDGDDNDKRIDYVIAALKQKPYEIKVEVEMEDYGYCEGCRKAGMWHCAHADTCGYAETRQQPKLDTEGCIILKKAK